jgi:hypothetical protein
MDLKLFNNKLREGLKPIQQEIFDLKEQEIKTNLSIILKTRLSNLRDVSNRIIETIKLLENISNININNSPEDLVIELNSIIKR